MKDDEHSNERITTSLCAGTRIETVEWSRVDQVDRSTTAAAWVSLISFRVLFVLKIALLSLGSRSDRLLHRRRDNGLADRIHRQPIGGLKDAQFRSINGATGASPWTRFRWHCSHVALMALIKTFVTVSCVLWQSSQVPNLQGHSFPLTRSFPTWFQLTHVTVELPHFTFLRLIKSSISYICKWVVLKVQKRLSVGWHSMIDRLLIETYRRAFARHFCNNFVIRSFVDLFNWIIIRSIAFFDLYP